MDGDGITRGLSERFIIYIIVYLLNNWNKGRWNDKNWDSKNIFYMETMVAKCFHSVVAPNWRIWIEIEIQKLLIYYDFCFIKTF